MRGYFGPAGQRRALTGAAGCFAAVTAAAAAAAVLLLAGCGTPISQAGTGTVEFGPSPSATPGRPPAGTRPPAAQQAAGCPAPQPAAPAAAAGPAAAPAGLPDGYHKSARPEADLCAALAAAARNHQEVLLDFGANWCVDCNVLMKLFRSPQVRPLLERDYRVVPVDIGTGSLNSGFAARYVTLDNSGIPALVVLNPAGKVRFSTDDGQFEHARTMHPAQVLAFLARWAPAAAGRAAPGAGRAAASYQGGGVRVTVVLAAASRGDRVEVTFAPAAPGFHLYSTALQPRLTRGLGIATRVSVRGGLRATGPLRADQPVRMLRIAVLHATLPVFPDGPVTVSVPVRALRSRPGYVVVSYAACSASVCLMPVIAHPIRLDLS